jgi:hypothetical protein
MKEKIDSLMPNHLISAHFIGLFDEKRRLQMLVRSTRNVVAIALLAITLSGCTKNANNNPQLPPLTPEQKTAIAKISAQTAAAGLAVAIDSAQRQLDKATDEASKTKLRARIKYFTLAKAILDEFNAQVATVTVIDLTNREGVKAAIKKALNGFDNLLTGDFLNLDPDLQSLLRASIAVAQGAMQSFDVLVPVSQ